MMLADDLVQAQLFFLLHLSSIVNYLRVNHWLFSFTQLLPNFVIINSRKERFKVRSESLPPATFLVAIILVSVIE